MVKISAFASLMPNKKFISKVPTKTYTSYSKNEINAEIQKNPYSFLNIITNHQIDKQIDRFTYTRNKIDTFKKNKILIKTQQKSLYIYRQSYKEKSYTGLICAISLKDYANKKIKPHEKTIEKREILFAQYLKNTQLHAEPVLITHNGDLKGIINPDNLDISKPTHSFFTGDGIKHEIWEINKKQEIEKIVVFFRQIHSLYIADGHHRLASSLRNNKDHMCLAYIVSKNAVNTLPFHRKILNIQDVDLILKRMYSKFRIQKNKNLKENSKHLQCYIKKSWYEIELNEQQSLVNNLLVSKLLYQILNPIFNIKDERKDKNVHFIPGNQSIMQEIKKCKHNECIFVMNTIEIDTIMEIADQNKTTPPKSTFILPKLPSGLIMMEL